MEEENSRLSQENGWLRDHLEDTKALLQQQKAAKQQAAAAQMSALQQLDQAVDAEHRAKEAEYAAKKHAVAAQAELSGKLDAAQQAAAHWQGVAAEQRMQLAQAQANVARLEQDLAKCKPCFGRSARLRRNCLPGLRLVVCHRLASSTLVALPAAGLLLSNAAAAWSAAMSKRPLPLFCRPPRCVHGRAALVLWLALGP